MRGESEGEAVGERGSGAKPEGLSGRESESVSGESGGEEGEREARKFPVTIAGGNHLYPYRTQKLSLQTLMVLSWERLGRVGSCRDPGGAGETEVFPAPKHNRRKPETSKESQRQAETTKHKQRKPNQRNGRMILSSSMAEHSAVNRRVVGSSPTWGATKGHRY